METLNYRQVHDMLVSCMDKILRNEPYLTRADSAIGDGDHGVGMCNGAEAAKRALAECWNGDNVYQMYASMAAAMQAAMGGASGMIFSTLYAGDAESHAPASEITAADLAELMASGLAAIKGIGGAAPGDKTMVDALEPAARTMVEHADEGFVPMLNAAVEAAAEGMEATKNMVAKYGRSKSLGERALGFKMLAQPPSGLSSHKCATTYVEQQRPIPTQTIFPRWKSLETMPLPLVTAALRRSSTTHTT